MIIEDLDSNSGEFLTGLLICKTVAIHEQKLQHSTRGSTCRASSDFESGIFTSSRKTGTFDVWFHAELFIKRT